MSRQVVRSGSHAHLTQQTVTVSGGSKSYFTTTSAAELCFGWHRAVRKGNMIYVSGVTAINESDGSIEPEVEHEGVATPNDAVTTQAQRQVLIPSGSGFAVVSADDLDRSRSRVLNSDEDEDEEPPPYDTPELGSSNPRRTHNETVLQVLHPDDVKQQAVVALNRCIEAVQSLHGKREDIAKVRMVITKHEHRRKVSEAFRECFSIDAPLTKPREHSRKMGRAGILVSEVGAAVTILVVPDGLPDPRLLVEAEVEAVLDGRH